jgi:succinyl-diaminopimelate desuccinylase
MAAQAARKWSSASRRAIERGDKARPESANMAMTTAALDLCRALVRCPSVTPRDCGALGVLEAALKQSGFATQRLTFSEPGTPDVDNLYARIGARGPFLVFVGHTDVVPPGDTAKWRLDPFGAEVADGAIWGRGTADMKSGVAAFTAAACAYVAQHGSDKGSIGFLITGDEEGPAINGTEKLLRWACEKGERFDHCIVGEPTSAEVLGDTIKIGRRGSLNGTLVVEGRQGHAAYPERADNPIPKLMRLLAALTAAPLDKGTAHFEPSNLEIVSVDVGNPAFNVIPAEARARFNIRFNDLWTPETLAAELRRRLERPVMAGPDPAIHHGSARDARVNPRIKSGDGHDERYLWVVLFETRYHIGIHKFIANPPGLVCPVMLLPVIVVARGAEAINARMAYGESIRRAAVTDYGDITSQSRASGQAPPRRSYRQIVFGKLTKVFPFAIVTYCVQQTGVYTGGAAGVYTGGAAGVYTGGAAGANTGGPNGPVGVCPATARPATPNWAKAAAALEAATLSTALADENPRGMATSAVSPILNIAGLAFSPRLPRQRGVTGVTYSAPCPPARRIIQRHDDKSASILWQPENLRRRAAGVPNWGMATFL